MKGRDLDMTTRQQVSVLIAVCVVVSIILAGCRAKSLSNDVHTQNNLSVQSVSGQSAEVNVSNTTTQAEQTNNLTENTTWYPAHRTKGNNGEDTVFIDQLHGWKMQGDGVATGANPVTIYKTEDGGEDWTKISSSQDKESNPESLPQMGLKTGITFLDVSTGWVGFDIPAPEPALYVTHDGGQTWQSQELPVPKNNDGLTFSITPPTFFTKLDGIINVTNIDNLLYVTHDSGKNWTLIEQNPKKGTNGNLNWDLSYDGKGQVTISNTLFITVDKGFTWTSSTTNNTSNAPTSDQVSRGAYVQGIISDIVIDSDTIKSITIKVTKNRPEYANNPVEYDDQGKTIDLVFRNDDNELTIEQLKDLQQRLKSGTEVILGFAQYLTNGKEPIKESVQGKDIYFKDSKGKFFNAIDSNIEYK